MGKSSANPAKYIVSFRVTRDEKEAIEVLARRQQTSVSQYLRGNVYTLFENALLTCLAGHNPALTSDIQDSSLCTGKVQPGKLASGS